MVFMSSTSLSFFLLLLVAVSYYTFLKWEMAAVIWDQFFYNHLENKKELFIICTEDLENILVVVRDFGSI